MVVVNPDGQEAIAATTIAINPTTVLLEEDFEDDFALESNGWSTSATEGTNDWRIANDQWASGSQSVFIEETNQQASNHFHIPSVNIPTNAEQSFLAFTVFTQLNSASALIPEVAIDGSSFTPLSNTLIRSNSSKAVATRPSAVVCHLPPLVDMKDDRYLCSLK